MLSEGYPRLETYTRIPEDRVFTEMQSFSDRFRDANLKAIKYYSKRWVANPLHHWSRRWEYLYVTERLGAFIAERDAEPLRLLDAGSGLTFFAHWLAYRFPSLRVQCCDRDPRSAAAAAHLVAPAQASVTYSTEDLAHLSYPDASFDAIACVSVLEHTRNYEAIGTEFARVLRPGGRLVLTIDISPDGRWQIPVSRARDLVELLSQNFRPAGSYLEWIDDFDPQRMLTTEHARRTDPTLLPWKYPSIRDAWHNRRLAEVVRPRFKYLTCFCMVWSRGP